LLKASVGRIVHYVSYGTPGGEYPSVCRAAVITAVVAPEELDEGHQFPAIVHLCVLNPEGLFFNQYVHQNETTKQGGTWHWPERENE
jgi:hypothetical protein